MEQIDQLNTLLLQDIDHNFARFHQVITSKLLPEIKRYALASEPTREASKVRPALQSGGVRFQTTYFWLSSSGAPSSKPQRPSKYPYRENSRLPRWTTNQACKRAAAICNIKLRATSRTATKTVKKTRVKKTFPSRVKIIRSCTATRYRRRLSPRRATSTRKAAMHTITTRRHRWTRQPTRRSKCSIESSRKSFNSATISTMEMTEVFLRSVIRPRCRLVMTITADGFNKGRVTTITKRNRRC